MSDFLINFLANLSASLIALFLGIPFGLMLDRLVQKRNKSSQKRVLFQALKDESIYNLRQMMNTLAVISADEKGTTVPGCHLSTTAWAAVTNGEKVEILWDSEALRLSLYFYRIVDRIHMNTKRLEHLSNSINGVGENQVNASIIRKMITNSIREGLDVGLSLLEKLDKELNEPPTIIAGIDEVKTYWDKGRK
ncbi:hypothetical protein KO465_07955 [Candidatus Micrarchaeota archaeon]|jgi:hypothetical protein|nr:hypothetical protein [Candidatus Micrarchaeota archaeon]